jgi:DNA repair protein RadA/Sms
MILAVLESRCNIPFTGHDVYLNVAGGMKISEPAADLAVATAILSALHNISLPADTVVYGEISLSGAVRPVNQAENRLKEARKLGFSKAMAPRHEKQIDVKDMAVAKTDDLMSFVLNIFEGK